MTVLLGYQVDGLCVVATDLCQGKVSGEDDSTLENELREKLLKSAMGDFSLSFAGRMTGLQYFIYQDGIPLQNFLEKPLRDQNPWFEEVSFCALLAVDHEAAQIYAGDSKSVLRGLEDCEYFFVSPEINGGVPKYGDLVEQRLSDFFGRESTRTPEELADELQQIILDIAQDEEHVEGAATYIVTPGNVELHCIVWVG